MIYAGGLTTETTCSITGINGTSALVFLLSVVSLYDLISSGVVQIPSEVTMWNEAKTICK